MRPTHRRPYTLRTLMHTLVLAGMLLGQVSSVLAAPARQDQPPMPTEAAITMPSETLGANNPAGPITVGGLELLLSEGSEASQPVSPIVRQVEGEPLTQEETDALLGRLPALETVVTDTLGFRLPEESLPAPSPDTRIDVAFPPTSTLTGTVPAEVETGPLEVLRFAPEGVIRIAPFLQVTFNQPMVPLGTLEELAAAEVPVVLTPQLPGVWKWQGTKTLTFEYRGETGDPEVDRFPMATQYEVEVPEGTTSATGGVLAESVRWSFQTPPPAVRITHPSYGPQPRNPIIFIGFDQRIDPEAVLNTVSVVASGAEVEVRLAGEEEILADPALVALTKQAGEGRWLALRPTEELPYNATVNVNVGPNTPSAEGPLVTDRVQSFTFTTYGRLAVTRSGCSWYDQDVCPPSAGFVVEFTNPLDQKLLTPEWVEVTPAIPGMQVYGYGQVLNISGAIAGRTTYTVTVSPEVTDIFGQTLQEPHTFTVETGGAYPYLVGSYNALTTLDPAGEPSFSVLSVNHGRLHVRVYQVTPDDWRAWQTYLRDYWQDSPPSVPGELVYDEVLATEARDDTPTETRIPLGDFLNADGKGHLIVIVDIPRPLFGERDNSVVQTWVQSTDLMLDALADHETLFAWATELATGAPAADVQVDLLGTQLEARTAADGTWLTELTDANGYMLVATRGEGESADVSILPRNQWDYYNDSGWKRTQTYDELRWFVFDDRQMYRPGEEVSIKGWIRRMGYGPTGDIGLVEDAPLSVQYSATDYAGNQIASNTIDLNALGGFDLRFTLPSNVNLGYVNLYFTANGLGGVASSDYYYSVQVQEFRRPEYAVTAQPEGEGPWVMGDTAQLSVEAAYYAGGALPGAPTNWTVRATAGSYSPPNWPEFTFGVWRPWWWYGYETVDSFNSFDMLYGEGATTGAGWSGATDALGKHYLNLQFLSAELPRPYSVSAEASVMDVNRQSWTSSTSLLVHPAELYVGLRSDANFVEAGRPITVETIVTDIDGNAVAEREVRVQAALREWQFEGGQWVQKETNLQECVVTSGNAPMACSLLLEQGGEYRIWAEVRDDRERLNRSEFTRWVSGGEGQPNRAVTMETVVIIPDKEEYQPGDVAELLVQAPWPNAEGIFTVARMGIVRSERFTMEGTSHTFSVPVEESYVPGFSVQVNLNGAAPRLDDAGKVLVDAEPRPAFAQGQLDLRVPPTTRTLTVAIDPDATSLAPGDETGIDVTVTDATGEPVAGAELAVVVVDEAILALTNYKIGDPLETFYRQMGSGIDFTAGRVTILLADPAALAANLSGGMGGGGAAPAAPAADMVGLSSRPMEAPAAEAATAYMMDMAPAPAATAVYGMPSAELKEESESASAQQTPIDVRTDFNPLALFAPAEPTGADGTARVTFTLPDSLTRYRVTVVAATEQQFGSAESNLTARLPLMVRPSAPRFLNFGDHFEFPIVLQNQTDEPLSVSVAMTTANIALDSPLGRRVEVPANDRIELRFAAGTTTAGTGRFQIAVSSDRYADAADGSLPIYTPATTEAFATYGVVDEGAVAQPLLTPTDVYTQFGGLEISSSSTALSALTDAVLYLHSYPFECSEQVASRMLAVAALRDVLTAFKAEGLPAPDVLTANMATDIVRLQALQNDDGGFPIWSRGDESLPFYTIHALHALAMAREKDFAVDAWTLERGLNYLRTIESYYPSWYSPLTKHTLSSYAVFVRDLMGDTDAAKARTLLGQYALEQQSLEAIGWLWQVLSGDSSSVDELEAIRRHVSNSAVETAGAANFFTSYDDQEWVLLHSNRRTDAILLDALIEDQPDSDLIPKVVTGLLAGRSNGRWNNTQENVFVLLALDSYFNTFENVEPDFVARVWLGGTFVAEHPFAGYTTESRQTTVPMGFLTDAAPGSTQDVIIAKEGDGRLYYRMGLSYAPTDLELDALDMGFVVQRSYEAVDNASDVQRLEDGTWVIAPGARVRVRLTMVADNRRYHVALVDPLPAGLEPINPGLATSGTLPADPQQATYGWWWGGAWYEHQNLRDSRAEAFTQLLWDGVYEYTYVAQATTPGTFVVPPAKAEEMYSPEVFGRSASDRVIVGEAANK